MYSSDYLKILDANLNVIRTKQLPPDYLGRGGLRFTDTLNFANFGIENFRAEDHSFKLFGGLITLCGHTYTAINNHHIPYAQGVIDDCLVYEKNGKIKLVNVYNGEKKTIYKDKQSEFVILSISKRDSAIFISSDKGRNLWKDGKMFTINCDIIPLDIALRGDYIYLLSRNATITRINYKEGGEHTYYAIYPASYFIGILDHKLIYADFGGGHLCCFDLREDMHIMMDNFNKELASIAETYHFLRRYFPEPIAWKIIYLASAD